MSVSKTANGRWRAFVKSGRATVATKTFNLKRDAYAWHDREKLALMMGEWVDPNAGKLSLGRASADWLVARKGTVAGSTFSRDKNIVELLPKALVNRPLNSLRASHFDDYWGELLRQDKSRGTVVRTRITLSALMTWAVKRNLITKNPIEQSTVPSGAQTGDTNEVNPLTLDQLRLIHSTLHGRIRDKNAADIVLLLGLTGLRWGELSALRVKDVQLVPFPALRVVRSRPDGELVRNVTKGGKPRLVPLTKELIDLVANRLDGPKDSPLFPDSAGGMRLLSNFRRATDWRSTGHTVKDLRHTAATMWLSNGVELATVSNWLGHSSVKITAEKYIHWMGQESDRAAIDRFNRAVGNAGGTHANGAAIIK